MFENRDDFDKYRFSQIEKIAGIVSNPNQIEPKEGMITIVTTSKEAVQIEVGEFNYYKQAYGDSIKAIITPDGLKKFPEGLKEDTKSAMMPNLESLVLNGDMEEIGEYAFSSSGLEKFKAPFSLKRIGHQAFAYSHLTEVELNEGLEEIDSSFEDTHIDKVELPASLVKYDSAFIGCQELTEVTFKEGIREVSDSAFASTGLKSITFPSSLEKIGDSAFFDCHDLRHAHFNEGLQNIDEFAFNQTSLRRVMLPKSIQEFEESAFVGVNGLANVLVEGDIKAPDIKEAMKESLADKNRLKNMIAKLKEIALGKKVVSEEKNVANDKEIEE